MGDSDEEYDRRRGREKFRRERNDYDHRDDRRRGGDVWEHDRSASRGSREVWSSRSREGRNRDPYGRDYDSRRRERYSPPRRDISPPHVKRMRRDWDDVGGGGGGGYPPYGGDMPYGGGGGPMHGGGPPPHNWGPGPDMNNMPGPQQQPGPFGGGPGQRLPEVDYPTQPPIMTFKQFLGQQDDSISEEDAIKKYNEYKLDFRRQQINEFFLAHKEEEWFKSKYHPEECDKRQEEIRTALKRRCEVFMELLDSGKMENITMDVEKSDDLVKLLDAAVIKMEGGTDFDLAVLDQPELEEMSRSRNDSESQAQDKSPVKERKRKRTISKEEEKPPEKPLKLTISADQKELMKKAAEFSKKKKEKKGDEEGEEDDDEDDNDEGDKKSKKKKRHRDKTEYSYDSGSESESVSGSDSEPEPAPPGLEDEPPPPGVEGGAETDIPGVTDSATGEKSKEGKEAEGDQKVSENGEKDVDTKEEAEQGEDKLELPRPRALHKMSSIFLRNLAPSITKQEVEAVCRRYPGFIRVALQDPQPERRFFRRGWVTFERSVKIKEVCWNLNNIRLRDCELGAILNRELKQRVRPVNGITAHKQVVKNDIKLGAKVIQNLDQKWKVWEDPVDEKKDPEKEPQFSLNSKNPVLKNITDYLVEEGSFEEEELLGESVDESPKEANPEITLERDETLSKVLDRMLLYLRIVHSIDYYSSNEYPNEDEMPHRCGIIHARGPTTVPSKLTQNDVNDWVNNFEGKIKPFVELQDKLDDEESVKLGKKDPEAEVEKFVTANTQELAKDKWLCPLSGKKFKGPEFVRKHIFNKHGEKVEEVKQEVSFFNNYLLDPKRPQLPEHPAAKQIPGGGGGGGREHFPNQGGFQGPPQQGMMGYNQPRPPMMYPGGPPSYAAPPYNNREGPYRGDPYRRSSNYQPRPYRSNMDRKWQPGHRRPDPRGLIEYRDLDAPEDSDMF